MDRQMDGCVSGLKDVWMGGWVAEWKDGWVIDGWKDEWTNV